MSIDLDPGGKEGKVFFLKTEEDQIELEGIKRDFTSSESSELESLVRSLLEGPTPVEAEKGYATEIPTGTRLIAFKATTDKITLDLSQSFVSGGGSSSMIYRLDQLYRTIESAKPSKAVYLMVEGKELKRAGGEGLLVERPFYRLEPNWLMSITKPIIKP
ncbi:MAG: GerMN domain-containing protein [Candidatus Caenarcaniphilales bacterium]|nr:GerMN domain-containing protein [Candidatus Caenarcaniphilales bacterium]